MGAGVSWLGGVALLFVVVSLGRAVVGRERRAESWALLRRLRPWPFLANLPAIAGVLVAFVVLYQVPWLRFGWWTLISGEPGNVFVSAAAGSVWVFAPFLVLLIAAMPQLVLGEEELFREGTQGWWQAVRRSVVFGLAHLVSGVPVAAGLALTVAGLWFSRQYFRGGVQRSALYHLAWNLELVGTAAVLLVVLAAIP